MSRESLQKLYYVMVETLNPVDPVTWLHPIGTVQCLIWSRPEVRNTWKRLAKTRLNGDGGYIKAYVTVDPHLVWNTAVFWFHCNGIETDLLFWWGKKSTFCIHQISWKTSLLWRIKVIQSWIGKHISHWRTLIADKPRYLTCQIFIAHYISELLPDCVIKKKSGLKS